jgi:acetyltransferase-like isoleucine patch superfamily enzyme
MPPVCSQRFGRRRVADDHRDQVRINLKLEDSNMSARYAVMRRIVQAQFLRRRAILEVGTGAQIRSLALRPAPGGVFSLGAGSIFAGRMTMDRDNASIRIGPRTFIGKGQMGAAQSIEIGADVLLSWDVTIVDHQSHHVDFAKRATDVTDWMAGRKDWSNVTIAPVRIGDKVWIGFGASILAGVTIGDGAVVGAGSIVTRDVAPWTIVAGNPARVIRQLEPS